MREGVLSSLSPVIASESPGLERMAMVRPALYSDACGASFYTQRHR